MIMNTILQSYIDPAATSILLSSITAIVVAVGATFIVLWRKFKKGVGKALHIDPNAGKEVEDELTVSEDVLAENAPAAEAAATVSQEDPAVQIEQETQQEQPAQAPEEKQ